MNKIPGIFVLRTRTFPDIYGPDEMRDIQKHVDLVAPQQTADSIRAHPELLAPVEAIFSGWGCPKLDENLLNAAPRLRAVFYGAGSLQSVVTDTLWNRGIVITSAWAANAVPVSEYTMAMITLALKQVLPAIRRLRKERKSSYQPYAGAYGSVVGLISLGMIGKMVRERLRSLDVKVLAYDPMMTPEQAKSLDVEPVSLEDLFRRADVVSLHTPLLDETRGMITGAHFALLKPGATFINTARGGVVRGDEMIAVARRRPDLQFVLDVTDPTEPPPPDSPLYDLENVFLTPHIAGCVGSECHRMGRCMVEELERYVADQPLKWAITPALAATSSHRPIPTK
jgi:phosphoglycerate dehydrogenase-like enzyme